MLYGRPPFHHITKPLPKMQAIIDPKVAIEFPSLKEKWEKSGHRFVTTPLSSPLFPPPPPLTQSSISDKELAACLDVMQGTLQRDATKRPPMKALLQVRPSHTPQLHTHHHMTAAAARVHFVRGVEGAV
jgi:hypothetical protein